MIACARHSPCNLTFSSHDLNSNSVSYQDGIMFFVIEQEYLEGVSWNLFLYL